MEIKHKSWLEIGRLKNSERFRRLPKLEQQALLEALEVQTHRSALRVRVALAVIYATALYCVAGVLCGLALSFHPIACSVALAVFGAFLGTLAGSAIASQQNPRDAAAMQVTTAAYVGMPGFIIACISLLVWLVRLAFFH